MESKINTIDNNSLETKQENDSNFTLGTQPELNEHTTTGSQQINNFQRQYGNMATLKLFQETMLAQTKLQPDQGQDVFEAEADQVAENTIDAREEQPRLTPAGIRIQRTPAGDNPAPTTSPPQATQTDPGAAAASPALIVEDTETELQPNQMRKSEFLSQLRTSVCAAAETALAGTMFSAMGCPWIDHWFKRYSTQNGQQLEATIRRFVPAAGVINSARDYIPLITNRVRQSIETWSNTGQITGLPEGFSANLPGSSGFVAGLASSDSSILRGAGSVISGIGSLLFKTRDNHNSRPSTDPHQVQSQLGSGRSLDSGVRSRMGSVFGQDFSNVRIHTDANAGQLSQDLNARAFTIGQDIAFGIGEYQPGSLIGDALIAHELAHVVQQGNGSNSLVPMQADQTGNTSFLEQEADLSAMNAVTSLWSGTKDALSGFGRNAIPRLRSGLRLQRCESERERETKRLAGLQRTFVEERYRERELERRRQEREAEVERLRTAGVENPENQVAEVNEEDIEVTPENVRDEMDRTVRANTPLPGPTARWDNLPDQGVYLTEARGVISNITTVAQGNSDYQDIVDLLDDIPIVISAETCVKALTKGYYAWYTGSSVEVGMRFIDNARADARNVFPIIAHEIGGHPVDRNYLKEISQEMLSGLDPEVRASLESQDYFMTYEYQSTEIYSAVRQRRYEHGMSGFTPTHGAIRSDPNIQLRLQQMKDNWHPGVVKAVLIDLLQQLANNPQVRPEDIEYLQSQIQSIIGYSLTIPASTRSHSGCGKGCCFPGYVKVSTPDGLRAIGNIAKGEFINIRCKKTGEVKPQQVQEVQLHYGEFRMLNLIVNEKPIFVTTRHWFGKKNAGWCSSELLQPHDILITASDTAQVSAVSAVQTWSGVVYNLKVKEECYFVGDAEALVRDY